MNTRHTPGTHIYIQERTPIDQIKNKKIFQKKGIRLLSTIELRLNLEPGSSGARL